MQRVIGIGGIFFQARDPDALRTWYRDHLGIDVQDWGGAVFVRDAPDSTPGGETTVWSVFEEGSGHFAPSTARFMVNYVVRDLDGVLAALRAEGCDVDPRTEVSDFGRFGWVMDPEGHRVELWEPPRRPAGES